MTNGTRYELVQVNDEGVYKVYVRTFVDAEFIEFLDGLKGYQKAWTDVEAGKPASYAYFQVDTDSATQRGIRQALNAAIDALECRAGMNDMAMYFDPSPGTMYDFELRMPARPDDEFLAKMREYPVFTGFEVDYRGRLLLNINPALGQSNARRKLAELLRDLHLRRALAGQLV